MPHKISWKRTIWFRLSVGSVAIVLMANVAVSLFILYSIGEMLTEEVQTRVRLDLNSARKLYDRWINEICLLMRATAARRMIPCPLESWNREPLHRLLEHIRQSGEFDILCLLDRKGRVIYRENNPKQTGDDVSYNPIVSQAIRKKKCVRGTAIVPYEHLLKEGPAVTRRAAMAVNPGRQARSQRKRMHRDAMVMGSAVVLVDLERSDECLGFLYGARLLNRSFELVDEIKEELYQDETFRGKEIGGATIFHKDIRISTSVKNSDGSRAIGTLVSSVVYEKVLKKAEIWADRAFAVNDWYITAYEPIRDPKGRVIGSLGVGILEAPFSSTRKIALWSFLGVMAITTLISLVLLTLATRTVLRPIGRIIKMSDRVTAGDLSARVRMRPPGEMGLLCKAIDQMADAVEQREKALKRTARQQIGQSEKLAAVGRMAAGIAHEINNPLTGLLTFEHLLKDEKNLSPKGREYLDLMYNETSRMREIIMGLLNFAREPSAGLTLLDVNETIRQWLTLLHSQKECADLLIEENLAEELPRIQGDANQLQQVLANLSFNACEAMPEGGKLTFTTWKQEKKVLISISDTGCGIKTEHMELIFDPFFTTKPIGKGTGLGLSVSYGIIRQHGGTMQVRSQEGQGTTFTIALPAASD
jgi:two-component system NtrC family sensor kinase